MGPRNATCGRAIFPSVRLFRLIFKGWSAGGRVRVVLTLEYAPLFFSPRSAHYSRTYVRGSRGYNGYKQVGLSS